jgi:ABC-type lipoprotein release transport system permease subunit
VAAESRDRPYEWTLAGRILRSRRSSHLTLVTAMSTAGIALGVGALIVVLAVNTGFQQAFQDRILATWPHLVVMRRGVDLRDWHEAVERLKSLKGVVNAVPATYDDMMLAGPTGRAGAVVRGIPSAALKALPEGAVIAGKLDLRGESPRHRWQGPELILESGTTAARHALIAGVQPQPWTREVALLPPANGMAGLAAFDAGGCGQVPGPPPQAELWLSHPTTGDTVRRAVRRSCGLAAQWEVAPGRWHVHWLDGAAVQRQAEVELREGAAHALVIGGGETRIVPPAPSSLGPNAAGVVVVGLDTGLAVRAPDGATEGWHALPADLPAVVVAEGLAKRLQVKPGDEVRAVSPLRGIDRGQEAAAGSAMGRFRVAAIVRTGFHDHDQRLAVVDFRAAQRFLARGDLARWVEVRIDEPLLAQARVQSVKAALEPVTLFELLQSTKALRERLQELERKPDAGTELRVPTSAVTTVDNWVSALRAARQVRVRTGSAWRVVDWEEMNRNIFDAARMQKVAMSLFPFIIVLVAALNVVGTQAVVVHERARDIAILRAMGATRRSVAAVFLLQGLTVGLVGTVLGLLLGGLACLLLDAVGYPLDPQVYLIARLPVLVQWQTFALAGGAAVALAFGAAWLSAQRAAGRPPVDALRRLD